MEHWYEVLPETRSSIKTMIDCVPNGYVCHLGPNTRTIEQNAKLWAMLNDVARDVTWYGEKLGPYDWKHIFTAGLKKSKCVPGIDGGVVVLGYSTSRMSKLEFSELIELILAFGAQHNVAFKETV
jgi:hypothetical protein